MKLKALIMALAIPLAFSATLTAQDIKSSFINTSRIESNKERLISRYSNLLPTGTSSLYKNTKSDSTTFTFDEEDRLIKTTIIPRAEPNNIKRSVEIEYNTDGNIDAFEIYKQNKKNSIFEVSDTYSKHKLTYNKSGQPTKMEVFDAKGVLNKEINVIYSNDGKILEETINNSGFEEKAIYSYEKDGLFKTYTAYGDSNEFKYDNLKEDWIKIAKHSTDN